MYVSAVTASGFDVSFTINTGTSQHLAFSYLVMA
jgi:hypothetical protein